MLCSLQNSNRSDFPLGPKTSTPPLGQRVPGPVRGPEALGRGITTGGGGGREGGGGRARGGRPGADAEQTAALCWKWNASEWASADMPFSSEVQLALEIDETF